MLLELLETLAGGLCVLLLVVEVLVNGFLHLDVHVHRVVAVVAFAIHQGQVSVFVNHQLLAAVVNVQLLVQCLDGLDLLGTVEGKLETLLTGLVELSNE